MATRVKIPTTWIETKGRFDINAFIRAQGLTLIQRVRDDAFWDIEIRETLNAAQQTALAVSLQQELDNILFEIF